MATKRSASKEQKVVVTLPDMGLSKSQIATLKRKFKNEIVTSMGGPQALRGIIIIVVIVIIFAAAPSEAR